MDPLGISIILYLAILFGLAIWANTKIENVEDFLVAGRKLPLSLVWATLFATWVGAGAVLTAADDVRLDGVRASAMEPFGVGLCLIVAGLFYAKPLWELKICTLSDFFKVRFGKKAEIISALLSVPAYFGWIAVQIIALAGIIKLFFGIAMWQGFLLVTIIATLYTLIGGMWSVTLTDAIQVILLIIGLCILGHNALAFYASGSALEGVSKLVANTPKEKLVFMPTDSIKEFVGWLGLFLVGTFGNIPGQDLTQRIFSANSGKTASKACILAGILYIVIGVLPVMLGLLANILLPEEIREGVIPALAQKVLTPELTIVFMLTLISMILSTLDSAILAPASILSQNILSYVFPKYKASLKLNHFSVLFVAVASFAVAHMGKGTHDLLEAAYALSLVALLAPLTMGLYSKKPSEKAAIVSMIMGIGVWSFSWGQEDFIASSLTIIATIASFVGYFITASLSNK